MIFKANLTSAPLSRIPGTPTESIYLRPTGSVVEPSSRAYWTVENTMVAVALSELNSPSKKLR